MRLAALRAGSAAMVISCRIRAVRVATTIGRTSSDSREIMMNATGRTVVQVLSGPTRQMLRRSVFNAIRAQQYACLHRHAILASCMVGSDRREFQRLSLAKPILGLLDGQNALILDIGVGGAFVEHYGMSLPGQRHKLLFKWKGEDVEFVAEIARSNVVRTTGPMSVSQSGLRFLQAIGKSENRLEDR